MESLSLSTSPTRIGAGKSDLLVPGTLGPYELLEKLGRGGMGTVYRAMHSRLMRPAAIKLLRSDRMEHPNSVRRFIREMEAVGRLDHPNLVRAYDAGEAEGRYFLAMELVVGADLCQLVDRRGPQRAADACEMVRQAARGLQNAHEHGLVHRDVKPSNLMVARDGTVKLLDLGLARLIGGDNHESTNTVADQLLGSGDYLAPEQGEDPRQADAQSDVYALGCVLYFLLVGHAPFDDSRHTTFGRKLLAHATERIPPIAQLRPDLPSGLVGLVDRMLAKRPADRPATMAEVAESLTAWTEGSNLAELGARLPKKPESVPLDLAAIDTPAVWVTGETDVDFRLLPAAAPRRAAAGRRFHPKLLAGGFGALAVVAAMVLPRMYTETPPGKPLGAAAMVQQPAPLPGATGWTLETRGGRATVTHLALSPDERLLAAGDSAGCVRVWRLATGDLARIVVEAEPVRGMAWLPCGRQLAVAAGTLRLWDVESGQQLWQAPLAEAEGVTALDYAADGTLASGHRNGEIRLWKLPDRTLSKVLSAHATPVTALRFSADGARLASGDKGRTIGVWSIPDGNSLQRVNDAEPGAIRRLAWSPDATRLASCGGGSHVTIWEESDRFRPRREKAANQPVGDLGWSPDGKRFFSVSGGEQGMEFAVLWDGDVQQPIHRPLMAPNAATALVWSRDATAVYCGARSGELLTYLPDSNETKTFRRAAARRTTASAWSPAGPRVLVGDCDGFSRLWDTDKVEQVFAVRTGEHQVSVLAWQPGGERFAAGHTDGVLVVADASTGRLEERIACRGHVLDAAFSPDGRWLATAEEFGLCRLWNAATGDEVHRFALEPPEVVNAVAWSPDGRYLAFSAWDARVRVVDVEQRKQLAEWDSGQGFVWRLLWKPEGRVLLTSGREGGIAYWDARQGSLLRRKGGCLLEEGLQSNVLGALRGCCASNALRAISADGTRNIRPTAGSAWEIRDLATGKVRMIGCPMPDGHWLAVEPATGCYQAELSALETPVYVVATKKGQDNCLPAEFAARYGWEGGP